MRWRVENSIGAQGLPVDAWAAAARARLRAEAAIERADVAASSEEDELALDASVIATLTVDVVVQGPEPHAAAALVERQVVAALGDIVGDDEVGWTAYDWEARPADE
jgi:hypothetical protein